MTSFCSGIQCGSASRALRPAAVLVAAAALALLLMDAACAQGIKITIPRHSQLTPVQRLNRDGVDAVRKHDYSKAEELFYKAYLYDPSDPFTLNNLGYIAELQGELSRAQNFYKLASEQGTDAFISLSSEKRLEGKRMSVALNSLRDTPMQVNRMNFDAMNLLAQRRSAEAETLLKQALRLDPQNSFTLNNLGVTEESIGDYDAALRYYDAAANARSSEPVVVTTAAAWRGKPVSEVALDNAQRLELRMKTIDLPAARAAMLASRGVTALNQNNWTSARQDFLQAYHLDPNSAFSLNNAGYVAEREGDVETANYFYARARAAGDAAARVGLATQMDAEGHPLQAVADNNNQETQDKLDAMRERRRHETGPIQLLHRNGTPVKTSEPPAQPPNGAAPSQPQVPNPQ
ncbi:MAG TPA: tetratricopeptide repeat protein [Acidobacteriaceae bacterium]|jgi:tetratricopeptide (TPR) repeat protein|nr:tetratricopeptide repeat protein [Acidobacteriaceae bacterium]